MKEKCFWCEKDTENPTSHNVLNILGMKEVIFLCEKCEKGNREAKELLKEYEK